MDKKKIICKCGESYVVIDPKSNEVICGVRGLTDLGNARLIRSESEVQCAKCNSIIYKDNS